MHTATALPLTRATGTFGVLPDQIPLPLARTSPILPVPIERENAGELRHRVARFMQAVAEVIYGERPIRQLAPWMSPDVYQQLHEHLGFDGWNQRPARGGARVVSVHLSMVTKESAEIAGRMVHAGRSHALAARLEQLRDHQGRVSWKCTALVWA